MHVAKTVKVPNQSYVIGLKLKRLCNLCIVLKIVFT